MIFDRTLQHLGIEPSTALIQTLVEIHRTHLPDIRLAPDAADVLPSILERWPVAVLTDEPPASQSAKARALGVTEIANPIVLTGCLGEGFAKPHSKGFQKIQNAVAAARFVYVADNPHKDFAGPRSLGWSTVRVRRAGGLHSAADCRPEPPDFEIGDFTSLLSTLSRIGAAI
jgi:putative hydrolase of the HAD superfamily